MLPSLYSPKKRTVESTVGGGGGLPGAEMRLEAVRTVDSLANGRADDWGTEEAVRRAVGPADSRGTPVADGRGTEEAVRRAVSSADSRGTPVADGWGTEEAVRCAVSLADSWRMPVADGRADGSSDGQGGRPGDRRAVVWTDARRDDRLRLT